MKTSILLPLLSAGACMVLASCETTSSQQTIRQRNTGYSLDDPPSGQARYQTSPVTQTGAPINTVESSDPNMQPTEAGVTSSSDVTQPSTPDSPPPAPPSPPVPPPPGPSPSVNAGAGAGGPPTYGKMVPGRPGFVYPPGVEAKPENMVDVRDFTPGQKVRDPRTGKIFLVP